MWVKKDVSVTKLLTDIMSFIDSQITVITKTIVYIMLNVIIVYLSL